MYLIEIIASAKNWWQNIIKIKFGDDDLAVKIDNIEFPKKNNKKGLFDGEVAWNGNNLKGLGKTDIFIINLSKGSHIITFLVDKNPTLKSIKIDKVNDEINYTPADNNPAEDGDRRQWMTVVLADLPLKNLAIKAVAKSYHDQNDQDDIKLIIDSEVQLNEDENDKNHKYWYWSGKILNGQEKEFNKKINKPKGLYYIELWADRMPEISGIILNLGLENEPNNGDDGKRISTVDDPEWTGNFNDDTEQMILARAIFGEVRATYVSDEGRIAVGCSIRNRVNAQSPDWGKTYHEVILDNNQYACFLKTDPNYKLVINPLGGGGINIDAWKNCYLIAGKIINNDIKDITEGSVFYHDVSYSQEKFLRAVPRAVFVKKIDRFMLYKVSQE